MARGLLDGRTMPGGVQYLPGREVHLAALRTGPQSLPRSALSGEDEVVQLDLPVLGRGADHERTADLTAVSAVAGAQAHGQEISLFHTPVGRPMSGKSGMGTGRHGGGEGRSLGTVVDQPPLQLQREVPLGTAHEDRLQQLAERLVGDLGRDAQGGDLLLVLDDPLLLHSQAEVGEAEAGAAVARARCRATVRWCSSTASAASPAACGEPGGGHRGVLDAPGGPGSALGAPGAGALCAPFMASRPSPGSSPPSAFSAFSASSTVSRRPSAGWPPFSGPPPGTETRVSRPSAPSSSTLSGAARPVR